MLTSTLLVKKRDGRSLSDDEIRFLIDGYCRGEVTDYQMSALAMAVCIRGMDDREITALTRAMLESGDKLDRSVSIDRERPRVDKHSTGGLGDKVSLILAPLLAACGVDVPMISGRGLGLTGGTLDKLESIPGFKTQLNSDQADRVLKDVGAFIIAANDRIAPADRSLYALRDVTGTVESVPLITASILSKKLSASLDALVMDVKTGSGAFMKTESQSLELARSLVRVGQQAGLPTSAILSDMDQPLGHAVGNAIEVNETVDVLRGAKGHVRDLTLALAAELLVQVRIDATQEDAMNRLIRALDDGSAMEKWEAMVSAQGGRLDSLLPIAPAHELLAQTSGFVSKIDCPAIGEAVVGLGGGRRRTNDVIDPQVGVFVHRKVGQEVKKGDLVLTLHAHNHHASEYAGTLRSAIEVSSTPVAQPSLILHRLASSDPTIEITP